MKRKIKPILVGALATIMLCSTALASPFLDVDESADYSDAVDYLSDVGIIVGDDLGNFNPNKPVTRAEMATIVCRMIGQASNLNNSNQFSDVPTNHWANPYVSKAVQLGVVNGYGNGKFGPSDTVTYEQAITMIVRAKGLENSALSAGGYPNGYIQVASANNYLNGVVSGVGTGLKRSDVAVIVYNAMRRGGATIPPQIGKYESADGLDDLTVYSVNGKTLRFSAGWYRVTSIENVSATLDGNVARFNYSFDGQFICAGFITFDGDRATLTITQSSDYIEKGDTVFKYVDPYERAEKNKAMLLWSIEDKGYYWVQSYSISDHLLAFHEDGYLAECIDGDWFSRTYKVLSDNEIVIDGTTYLYYVEENDPAHNFFTSLYLTSPGMKGTAPFDGTYLLECLD